MTLLLGFLVMLLAVLGLSLGVLLGRRPIQGSCGGVGSRCGACTSTCRRHPDRPPIEE